MEGPRPGQALYLSYTPLLYMGMQWQHKAKIQIENIMLKLIKHYTQNTNYYYYYNYYCLQPDKVN